MLVSSNSGPAERSPANGAPHCPITDRARPELDISECKWRPEPESNRRARICSPLRNHSAIGPRDAFPRLACNGQVRSGQGWLTRSLIGPAEMSSDHLDLPLNKQLFGWE